MVLDFKLLEYLVKGSRLFEFIRWLINGQKSLLGKFKVFVKLIISVRVAAPEKKTQFHCYSVFVPSLSWVRYGSDGLRILLYDKDNKVIGKLPRTSNSEQFKAELEVRDLVKELSPPIVAVDPESGCIIERWIGLRPWPPKKEAGLEALKLLKEKLFAPVHMDIRDYFTRYSNTPYSDQVLDTALYYGITDVIICYCHGDFWNNNIFMTYQGHILLLDWEYAGTRIHTYDAWFFTFHQWAVEKKRDCDADFFEVLGETFRSIYSESYSLKMLQATHMLHLFERFAAQLSLGKPPTSNEMQLLKLALLSAIHTH